MAGGRAVDGGTAPPDDGADGDDDGSATAGAGAVATDGGTTPTGDDAAGHGADGQQADAADAGVSRAEAVVMVLALGVTVALFAFAGWQALAGATTVAPTATVTGAPATAGNGSYYAVTLRNEGDVGLVSVTVSVDCPTPSRTVTFENVPAQSRRNATVRCPPGASPSAEVTSWVAE